MSQFTITAELRYYFRYYLTLFSMIGFWMATFPFPGSLSEPLFGLKYYRWFVPSALFIHNLLSSRFIPDGFFILLFHIWWVWGWIILTTTTIIKPGEIEIMFKEMPYELILISSPFTMFWFPILSALFMFPDPRHEDSPPTPDEQPTEDVTLVSIV